MCSHLPIVIWSESRSEHVGHGACRDNDERLRVFREAPARYAGVVATVSTAVSLLTNLPALVPVLKDLGCRHCGYNVQPEHYPIVGAAFLKTLKLGLGAAYTDEVAQAYTAMWSVVAATMLSGAPKDHAYPIKG